MNCILFIYNPVAGMGRVKKNLFEIVDFYDTNNCIVTLCPVWKLNDYYEKLGIESGRYDRIVCSGGDGTLNIVVSFMKQKNISVPIAYVPSGSTNDFAYSLGLSNDLNEALEITLKGAPRAIDIGQFNDRYFLYVAAFGAFTKAAYSTPQRAKNILGHTAYILEGIRQISELKAYPLTVKTDDEVLEGSFILGLVTNSLSIGGFKSRMLGNVELDDGRFEVILIKKPESAAELHEAATSLMRESLDDNKYIVHRKTKKLEVISEGAIDWTLDGEYGGNLKRVEIINLKKDVFVVV